MGKDTTARESTTSLKKRPKKTACRCGLRTRKWKTHCTFHKIKSKYWKIHRSLTCAKKRYPTKYCKGSQNEENAFLEMHGIHGAANSGVTLFFPLMFEGFFSFPTHSVFHFRLPPRFQHKCVYGQVSTYTDKCPPSTSQV